MLKSKRWLLGVSVAALAGIGIIWLCRPAEQPVLTAEDAKAALVDLFRTSPKTFEVQFDPDQYAAEPIEEDGAGQYKFGWFHVDVPNKKYRLNLVPKEDSFAACIVDYDGSFEFKSGRWVARKPAVSYGKIR
jgi:hypothetical protein